MEEKERFTLECGRVKNPSNVNFKHIEYEVDENGCWNCVSHSCDSSGYPRVSYKNKMYKISRFIYEFYKEKIKDGNVILHSCDNPKCINPEHLSQGTHQENMIDMVNKKRYSVKMKIDVWVEETILDIYDLYHNKIYNQRELSEKYNMSRSIINKIVRGISYKYLTQTR